ncbi:signal transducing adapter molecule 1 [Caerostris extrusa]|uniref:Signal transducing adapter molecule 1 n=1 Tax=Caerostris extrusa TaxID=172846 RepID=A0AAV4QB79_CAEEX|nr:signal transducing adapter molecule 1 [Caerostris extrusa]
MPRFSSPFDQAVEKATSEMNTSEDYQTIFEICDKIDSTPNGPKEALRSISKRLNSNVPLHVMHALTLLDCCVKNCGRKFHLEVCSRDFETEIKKLLSKGHAKCVEKLKELLKKWTEEEFKNDPELSLIPSLYHSIKTESQLSDINAHRSKESSSARESKKEDEDLAKAIELSLKESKTTGSSLYPNTSLASSSSMIKTVKKEPRKVRALYDFIAAEENELSFKSGDIIHIIDDSDPSWFLGSNQNGEGLFPANFVTSDLSMESLPTAKTEKKTVQFNEEVKVKTLVETPVEEVVIDEKKIDTMLAALHDADPTGQIPDTDELLALEDHCLAMGPLIEQELEQVDRRHAELTQCNKLLVDALKSYETLMKSYPSIPYAPYQVPPDVMHSYPQPQPTHMFNNHLQHHLGEPYQPVSVPGNHDHFPVSLPALPTTLQSQNIQSVAEPQVPYDVSNMNSYGNIPHTSVAGGNYSVPVPSREGNGLYYGDLRSNSMQHNTTSISMHQPML